MTRSIFSPVEQRHSWGLGRDSAERVWAEVREISHSAAPLGSVGDSLRKPCRRFSVVSFGSPTCRCASEGSSRKRFGGGRRRGDDSWQRFPARNTPDHRGQVRGCYLHGYEHAYLCHARSRRGPATDRLDQSGRRSPFAGRGFFRAIKFLPATGPRTEVLPFAVLIHQNESAQERFFKQ